MALSLNDLTNKYNSYASSTLNMLLIYFMVNRLGVDPSEIDTLIAQIEEELEESGVLISSPSVFDQTLTSELITMFTNIYYGSTNDATTTSELLTVIAHLAESINDSTSTSENITMVSKFIPTVSDATTTSENITIAEA